MESDFVSRIAAVNAACSGSQTSRKASVDAAIKSTMERSDKPQMGKPLDTVSRGFQRVWVHNKHFRKAKMVSVVTLALLAV